MKKKVKGNSLWIVVSDNEQTKNKQQQKHKIRLK